MTKVLMVVSAAGHWTLKDGTKHPTGFWAEELIAPYDVFNEAGFDITIATPGARVPKVDPGSLKITSAVLPSTAKRMKKRLAELAPTLTSPSKLSEVNPEDFDVLFYPGGHGPMEDLVSDADSAAILKSFDDASKIIGVLCHSPAALLATIDKHGNTPFAGRRLTAFSNREERLQPVGWKAKWYLETRLKEAGINHSKGLPLRPYVVVDRNLYSGQNPQSSTKLAQTIVSAVKESTTAAD